MLTIDRLQVRLHAMSEELGALNREPLKIDAADVADRWLVLDYIGDVRQELDLLEQRLGIGRRRAVALPAGADSETRA
jgi:hypothetical protein